MDPWNEVFRYCSYNVSAWEKSEFYMPILFPKSLLILCDVLLGVVDCKHLSGNSVISQSNH